MLNRGDFGKRGLSPVIASVLLVMLVLVLAVIIFLWARGFITEQIEKFGQPVEQQCANVDFEVALFEEYGEYKMDAVNHGNVPIGYLDIKKVKGGNSEIESYKLFRLRSEETLAGAGVDVLMDDGSDPSEIVVYPVLLGNVRGKDASKPFTCIEQGKTIIL